MLNDLTKSERLGSLLSRDNLRRAERAGEIISLLAQLKIKKREILLY